jgi:hypothetical protein
MSSIMDLHPYSRFSLSIDDDLYQQILHKIFDSIDNLSQMIFIYIFLVNFFNINCDSKGWDNAVKKLTIDDKEPLIIKKNAKKLLKQILFQL